MTDWYVGQRVVCVVDRSFWRARSWTHFWKQLRLGFRAPRKLGVYEIAAIELRPRLVGDIGLALVGHPAWCWYAAGGFRPLVSQNADLSVFHEILARLPADAVRLS